MVDTCLLYLDPLDELGLVFPDGSSDVGPDEEGVEPGEDPEHLVGVLGGAELEEKVNRRSSKNGKDDLATWRHTKCPNVQNPRKPNQDPYRATLLLLLLM